MESGKTLIRTIVTHASHLVQPVPIQLQSAPHVLSVNTLTTNSVNNAQSQIVMTVSMQISASRTHALKGISLTINNHVQNVGKTVTNAQQ
jgi:hypothetical protein